MASYLPLGARVVIGLVLLASLIAKVRVRAAVTTFAAAIRGLQLVPDGAARAVASVVLISEAAICVLLAVPTIYRLGLGLAIALMTTYAIVVAAVMRRGVRAPCGCFGSSDERPLGYPQLARNLFLAGVGIAGLATIAGGPGPERHPAGKLIAIATAALVALLVIHLDDIVDLLAPLPNPYH